MANTSRQNTEPQPAGAVSAANPRDLANAERAANEQIADTPARWVVLACAAVLLVCLALPFAGDAAGWQVLLGRGAARDAGASIAEYLFSWFSLVGLGALGSLSVFTRRYRMAAIGWVLTCMSVVFALMSVWLRRSSAAGLPGHGAGAVVAMLAALVAAFAFVPMVTRRGAEQEAIAVERAAAQGHDEVAQAQRQATERAQENNPLLVDDRRARAAERHKR